MTPVPLELPVRPGEAASLADLVFQHLEGRPLNEEVRQRLAARAAALELTSIRPYFGSLVRDTVHQNAYYLAVDGLAGPASVPLLLYLTQASAPANALFPGALLIGRMRSAGGREVVVSAIPFGPQDGGSIRVFADTLDRAFLPRPQGALPALAVRCRRPERDLPAAFDAFRRIQRQTGENWASVEAPYEACLWAAIRAGWREGYSVEAPRMEASGAGGASQMSEAVRNAAHATKFSLDISRMTGAAGPDAGGSWLMEEFERPFVIAGATYTFAREEIVELASEYGAGLSLTEEIHDLIRRTKSSLGAARAFDLEISVGGAGARFTPRRLLFCLHWLKSRGRAAQLIAPPLAPDTVAGMAAVARYFNATLSFELASAGEGLLDEIGAATAGRVNCRVSGEFDAESLAGLAARLRG